MGIIKKAKHLNKQGKQNMLSAFNEEFVLKIRSAKAAQILQPITIGKSHLQNELVFFLKPDLFLVNEDEKILNSLNLINNKFAEYKVEVNGMVVLPGKVLEEHEIMSRHYGFINQLSRQASTVITGDLRKQLFATLNLTDDGSHKILGGHEFLITFPMAIEDLNKIWFGQGAQKVRSGLYAIADSIDGEPFILVNGFHPSQLMHFTQPDHHILLMLIHTNADWFDLKFKLVGDTFPENAAADSIRGELFANPGFYGQKVVNINANGVHLSAGPFEAAYEVVNFFGKILPYDVKKTPPLAIQRAIEAGIAQTKAISLLENPTIDGQDLFTATENMNTKEAVEFAL